MSEDDADLGCVLFVCSCCKFGGGGGGGVIAQIYNPQECPKVYFLLLPAPCSPVSNHVAQWAHNVLEWQLKMISAPDPKNGGGGSGPMEEGEISLKA
jgi:hypothetical protein